MGNRKSKSSCISATWFHPERFLLGWRCRGRFFEVGGFRGRSPLGEGVESNEVRTRGRLPPFLQRKFVFTLKIGVLSPKTTFYRFFWKICFFIELFRKITCILLTKFSGLGPLGAFFAMGPSGNRNGDIYGRRFASPYATHPEGCRR